MTGFAINIRGPKWYIVTPALGRERMRRMETEEELAADEINPADEPADRDQYVDIMSICQEHIVP